jgi:hypothetical protein
VPVAAWTLHGVARLWHALCAFEVLWHVTCAQVIDLGPADGWRYLRSFSPRRLPLQMRSYMLCYLRLFSPRRLPLQTLRTLYASHTGGTKARKES